MSHPDQQPPTDDALEEVPALLPTSPWAISSFVLGLLSIVLFATTVGDFLGIFAVVCGHSARQQIKTGQRGGARWAMCGLILGYFMLLTKLITNLVANFS